jgi:hypothetical protein
MTDRDENTPHMQPMSHTVRGIYIGDYSSSKSSLISLSPETLKIVF